MSSIINADMLKMLRVRARAHHTWLRATILSMILTTFYYFSSSRRTKFTPSYSTNPDAYITSPSGDNVIIVVKTGATEASKILTQM